MRIILLLMLIISNTYAGEIISVDLSKEKQSLDLCRQEQNVLKFNEDITSVSSSSTLVKETNLEVNYKGKFIVLDNQKDDGSIVVSSEKHVSLIQLKYLNCKEPKLKKITLD